MRVIVGLAVVLTLAGASAVAWADRPGPDWMPLEQVAQKLKQFGYAQIWELQADDGHWEGEGIKNGRKMEFHVDPHTGFISERPD
ncbi:MAG TPA: PepSY domain-containing protein [Stellaceae bacterium]|nr:PepSY domain-containing protein [Stellaceae bacterium]